MTTDSSRRRAAAPRPRPLVAGDPVRVDERQVERPVCRAMLAGLDALGAAMRIEPWHGWLAAELVDHAPALDDHVAAGVLALTALLLARVDDGDVLLRLDPDAPGPVADLVTALRRAVRTQAPGTSAPTGDTEAPGTSAPTEAPGGDTWAAALPEAVASACAALRSLETGRADADLLHASAVVICGPASAARPLVVDSGDLYLHRLHRAEVRVAGALARRAASSGLRRDRDAIDAAIADVLQRPAHFGGQPVALADEQVLAVRAACLHPVTVVSGGPGTGKTSVVVAILRALVRLGLDPDRVALAAPTGKAAWRMGEALDQGLDRIPRDRRAAADVRLAAASLEPRTLHRLLRWSPGAARFEHSERLPLPADVVIVDESSMVPLALMDRLIAAVADGARLILLGDADQLPSVEAGSVFADLAPPRGAPPTPVASSSIRLQRSFRMREDDPAGRAILTVARRVRDGDTALAPGGSGVAGIERRAHPRELVGFGVEAIDARGSALEAVVVDRLVAAMFGSVAARDRWLSPRTRAGDGFDEATADALHGLFDALESTRVLCVTRRGPRGADAVSARIDAHVRALDPRASTGVGAPVLITRNDARRGLFNGDLGVVLDIRAADATAPTPRAVFRRGDRFVTFAPAAIAGISRRSWALTVHKAQGSEVDDLVLVLPSEDGPLLNRAILYTALTRARRSVVIAGADARIADAVRRDRPRATRLAERLEDRWQIAAP